MTLTGQSVTWADLYRGACEQLPDRREARWMVEEASGSPFGQATGPVPDRARRRLADMVRRRQGGEPLQYVLGSWSFRGLELMVDRRALIPRPETEQVVDVALGEVDRLVAGSDGRLAAVDLGTGSGAIALALASERRCVDVWAVDRSAEALAVAGANLAGMAGSAAARVRLVEGDWWDGLPADLRGRIDVAVSNPPYISTDEMEGLDPQVRDWEPRAALEAGPVGTEAIGRILAGAPAWLSARGSMVIELAPDQADPVRRLAQQAGFTDVDVRPDLAGRPRALVARR